MYDGADMSGPQAIETMMARAIGEFGAVDILVNNAGIQHVAPIEEFPVAKWDAIMAIKWRRLDHRRHPAGRRRLDRPLAEEEMR
jgi:3-hydroxybutyrate dehydrogenase